MGLIADLVGRWCDNRDLPRRQKVTGAVTLDDASRAVKTVRSVGQLSGPYRESDNSRALGERKLYW